MKSTSIRKFSSARWWANVSALLNDSGITGKELSGMIGKTEFYIQNAVRNGGAPNIADALAIADVFGKSIEELAFGALSLQIRRKKLVAELEEVMNEISAAEADMRRK